MDQTIERKRLTVRDLATIGIFSAVMCPNGTCRGCHRDCTRTVFVFPGYLCHTGRADVYADCGEGA